MNQNFIYKDVRAAYINKILCVIHSITFNFKTLEIKICKGITSPFFYINTSLSLLPLRNAIIGVIKSRMIRWVGSVTYMMVMKNACETLVGKP
jgi:hypothetical protein